METPQWALDLADEIAAFQRRHVADYEPSVNTATPFWCACGTKVATRAAMREHHRDVLAAFLVSKL